MLSDWRVTMIDSSAKECQRQRQKNRDGVQPRFELCRENQYENERQKERHDEVLRGAAELARPSCVGRGSRGRAEAARIRRRWRSTVDCEADGRRFAMMVTWLSIESVDVRGAVSDENLAMLSSETLPSRDDGTVRAPLPAR
jgi:hypothetical protein